jgi:hypothetical protein
VISDSRTEKSPLVAMILKGLPPIMQPSPLVTWATERSVLGPILTALPRLSSQSTRTISGWIEGSMPVAVTTWFSMGASAHCQVETFD